MAQYSPSIINQFEIELVNCNQAGHDEKEI